MKMYHIDIKRVLLGCVEVEAKNEEDAEDKAFKEIENGRVEWEKEDVEEMEVEEID